MKKLFVNGKFYPLRDSLDGNLMADFDEFFNSMLVSDRKIISLQNDITIEQVDEVIDLNGKTIIPSFTDAHVHFFQTGFLLDGADFSNLQSKDELLTIISERIAGRKYFQSWGYDPSSISPDAELPSREELDRINSEIPIFIRRKDGHSSALNSASIKLLNENLTDFNVKSEKGHLYDFQHLEAERFFLGLAGEKELYKAIKEVEKRALSVGATSIHGLVHRKDWAKLLKNTQANINIEIYLESWNPYDAVEIGLKRVGGCLLLDGSFGSHTAALSVEYCDRQNWKGELYKSNKELEEFITIAEEHKLQTSFHAIGDKATMQMLKVHSQFNNPEFRALRHRIEHAELQFDEQIELASQLEIVYAMQPAFEHFWGGMNNMYGERLGHWAMSTNRFASILSAGIRIAGSSDSYVTPIDPLLGIHAAVNHPNPVEAIEVGAALRLFTIGGPYAISQEERRGSLEKGKEASFIVLSDNPFEIEKNKIKDINVLETYVSGELLYKLGD